MELFSIPEQLHFSVAALWCVTGFGLYYFLSHSASFSARIGVLCRHLDMQGNRILLQRILGFLFLGLNSALIIAVLPGSSLSAFGLNFTFLAAPPWWSWLLPPLILILGFYAARKPSNLEQYPQIRSKEWPAATIMISAASWVLFLVGYEFLFRGFLLQSSLNLMGAGPAIALNCALYAFAHFYKGPAETFGAIPVGIILCYLTMVTGNIWSAVALHSIMALSNEWFSLRAHPEMKILKAD